MFVLAYNDVLLCQVVRVVYIATMAAVRANDNSKCVVIYRTLHLQLGPLANEIIKTSIIILLSRILF